MDNKQGVSIVEQRRFNFTISFPDGEKTVDGETKPHTRQYGFSVEEKSAEEAKTMLLDHLRKCVAELEKPTL